MVVELEFKNTKEENPPNDVVLLCRVEWINGSLYPAILVHRENGVWEIHDPSPTNTACDLGEDEQVISFAVLPKLLF